MKKCSVNLLLLVVFFTVGFFAGRAEVLIAYASPLLQAGDVCGDIESLTDVNETLKCLVKLELENGEKLDQLLAAQPAQPESRAQSGERTQTQRGTLSEFINSAEPAPEPIELTGTGPSVVDIEKGNYPAIAVIEGNETGGFFAITSLDANGKMLNLLVNTTEPYSGIRPLDIAQNELTARLEIETEGEWSINILPVTEANTLPVPGVYEGEGDNVLILDGVADTATISGNSAGSSFVVLGYSSTSFDLLANTTEPYEGEVIVNPDTIVLEIEAVGPWSISVE